LDDLAQRDEFLEYTNANGVMTRPIWTLMNRLEMFKDAQCGDLSNAQYLEDRVVNIPSSVTMTKI
jgi:perosamine synthetase